MYGDGSVESGNGLRLVSCTLSELSNCSCLFDCSEEKQSSSQRRKAGAKPVLFEPADMLAELSARKVLLSRQPTLIDRLIFQNKSALMAPKKKKVEPVKEKTAIPKGAVKRKSESTKNQPPTKRVKRDENNKKPNKGRNKVSASNNTNKQLKKVKIKGKQGESESSNRTTRINSSKAKVPILLRSGRSMTDILKKKNRLKKLVQISRKTKIDSNSNVFNEKTEDTKKEEQERKTVKEDEGKTAKKDTKLQEERVVRKKRRKRCSMWHVKKIKRPPKKEEDDEVAEEDDDEAERDAEEIPVDQESEKCAESVELQLVEDAEQVDKTKQVDETQNKLEEIVFETEMEKENVEMETVNERLESLDDVNKEIDKPEEIKIESDIVHKEEVQVKKLEVISKDISFEQIEPSAKEEETVVWEEEEEYIKMSPPFKDKFEEPVIETPNKKSDEKDEEIVALKKETLDADSTSDVPHTANDSISDLSLFLPDDEIELLNQTEPRNEVLPDSTKVSIEKEEIKEDEKKYDEGIENEDNEIDEKLLAEVQTQLEQQELNRANKLNAFEFSEEDKLQEEIQEDQNEQTSQNIEESCEKESKVETVEMTREQRQMKESVLHALGLKSLDSEEKPPKRSEGYTGTLKAIIKLNRFGDKKQMVYKRAEGGISPNDKLEYKICSEAMSQEDQEVQNINQNKMRSNSINSNSLPSSPMDFDSKEDKGISEKESLIIPEKSSSFSIHPGRLCSDVCSYCFGKFGSLDTPCHVAQLKGEERQKKILQNEPHLTGESCLCDACYRYVDRKANCQSKSIQGNGNNIKSKLTTLAECCVTGCTEKATRSIKRKWLVKLKKSINHKLEIGDKMSHGIFYPLCTNHHNWVEYLTVCGICRRRLNRNNLFSLGLETDRLNLMLAEDGIPARLSDNLFLCKLCRYYSDLRLKYTDTEAIPPDKKAFYKDYRRKILLSLDIALSESDEDSMDVQRDMRAQESTSTNGDVENESDDKGKDEMMSLHGLATLLGDQPQQQARIQVKFGNVNIGTLSNLNIGQQGNSTNSKLSPKSDGSNSPALSAQLEYQGSSTPDGSWERYTSTIMFDKKTKQLWTELQRPYGSQSSFLRHLVMLEKVWRAGFLVLRPDADERAVKYITSAKNRIHAFEGTPVPKKEQEIKEPHEPVMSTPLPQAAQQPLSQSQLQHQPKPHVAVHPPKPAYPVFPATGEIEVTEIKNEHSIPSTKLNTVQQSRPPQVTIQHRPQNSMQPQMRVPMQQHLMTHQHQIPQQHQMPDKYRDMYMRQHAKKKISPLDRAKSLVRMAPPIGYQQQQQFYQMHQQRKQGMINYNSSISQPPPLLKLGQQYRNRPILPKLPKALTVVSMPASSSQSQPTHNPPSAITLKHSGITIEKQVAPARHHLPIEKPSISVFREPSTHQP